jgi:hypothetical protein
MTGIWIQQASLRIWTQKSPQADKQIRSSGPPAATQAVMHSKQSSGSETSAYVQPCHKFLTQFSCSIF